MGLYDRDYMRAGASGNAPGQNGDGSSRRKARNMIIVVLAVIVLLAILIARLI